MISMDLRKHIDGKVDPIQITKDIFSKIKASDSAALLVPIKDQWKEANYIIEPIYISTQKKALLTCPTAL